MNLSDTLDDLRMNLQAVRYLLFQADCTGDMNEREAISTAMSATIEKALNTLEQAQTLAREKA